MDPAWVEYLFTGVPPHWRAVLERAGALQCMMAVLTEEKDHAEIVPHPSDVFSAFRWTQKPQMISAVILGQAPTTSCDEDGAIHADGLAFSVKECPESDAPARGPQPFASTIFGALGVPPEKTFADLRPWASQGVLLLNTTLTSRKGGDASTHRELWSTFIPALISELTALRKKLEIALPLPVLLWGDKARRTAELFKTIPGAVCLEWGYPSAAADSHKHEHERFAFCPHFRMVNEYRAAYGLKPIEWNPAVKSWAAFDGSAPRDYSRSVERGTSTFFASCGSVVETGPAAMCADGEAREQGVAIQEGFYALMDEPAGPRIQCFSSSADGSAFPPTNQRGELMGLALTLCELVRARVRGDVEIISDSEYTVKMILEWLPSRRRKDSAAGGAGEKGVAGLKNPDIIAICETLFLRLKALTGDRVEIRWVKAHRPSPEDKKFRFHHLPLDPPEGSPEDRKLRKWLWYLNDKADTVADDGLPEGVKG
jgi:uracil-DNA glycosylase